MVFSIVVSPFSSQTAKASMMLSDAEAVQVNNTIRISWHTDDFIGEDFVDFKLIKNGESFKIEPVVVQEQGSPEDSVFITDYSYIDADINKSTQYTYQIVGITSSGEEYSSAELSLMTSDFEDVDAPTVSSVELMIGGQAIPAVQTAENEYSASIKGLQDTDMFTDISINASADAANATFSFLMNSKTFDFTNGLATANISEILGELDSQQDGVSVGKLKEQMSLYGGKISGTIVDYSGNESEIVLQVSEEEVTEVIVEEPATEQPVPSEQDNQEEVGEASGQVIDYMVIDISGIGVQPMEMGDNQFTLNMEHFLDPAFTIGSALENDDSLVNDLTLFSSGNPSEAWISYNGSTHSVAFADGVGSLSVKELLGISESDDLTLGEFKQFFADNGDGDISITVTEQSGATKEVTLSIVGSENFKTVEIPDAQLVSAIRDHLGIYEGALTAANLKELVYLYAQGEGITDLTGLEYATNLEGLDVSANDITDVSPIASLTNLTSLTLWGTQISDISGLSSLTNLTYLDLEDNHQLVDISPIESLVNLETLRLSYSAVTDITDVSSLSNLRELHLYGLSLDLSEGSATSSTINDLQSRGVSVYFDWMPEYPVYDEYLYLYHTGQGVTHNSFEFEWDSYGDFESYDIYLDGNLVKSLSSTSTNYVLSGLQPRTTYNVEVKGNLVDGRVVSSSTEITTSWAPEDLQEVKIQAVNENDQPLTNGYQYSISGTDESNQDFFQYGYVNYEGYLTSWEINSLQLPLGTYDVIIYDPENYDNSTIYSIEIEEGVNYIENPFKLTFNEGENSSEPFKVKVTNVTENSITVEWTNQSKVTNYSLYLYSEDSSYYEGQHVTLENGTTSYTFTNLSSDTRYGFSLNAEFSNGLSYGTYMFIKTNGGSQEGEIVTFADTTLEQIVREEIGVYSRDITSVDLEELTYLYAYDQQITSLAGLEHAVNLQGLGLGSNEIEDISPLTGLTSLTDLTLWDNNITDVSPLSNLTQLTYLDLDSNKIVDVTPLGSLTNLRDLWLYNNPIGDFTTLEELRAAGVNVYYNNYPGEYYEYLYVNLLDVTENSISIDWSIWNQSEEVDYFDVTIGDTVVTVETDTLSHVFNDLSSNTFYEIQVDAHYVDGRVISGYNAAWTDYPADQLRDVNINLNNQTDLSIENYEFSINGMDDANQRVFEYGYVSESGEFKSFYDDEPFSLPVGQYEVFLYGPPGVFNQYSTYQFEVLEGTDYIASPVELVFDGFDGEFEPGPSLGIQVVNTTDTSIEISWNQVPDVIGYSVCIEEQNEQDYSSSCITEESLDLTVTSYTFTDLLPNTNYIISVNASYTDSGFGEGILVQTTGSSEGENPGQDPEEDLGEVVNIPDGALSEAIRNTLNVYDRDLYTSDLEQLTSLYASHLGITDLTGLDKAVNLTYLDVSFNQISDVTPLQSLTSLTNLILWSNEITEIGPLSSLTNLTYLDLDTNKINDVSPLAGLTNLDTLWLANNPASDISSLIDLTNLTNLYLYGMPLDVNDSATMNTIETLQNAGVYVSYDSQIYEPSIYAYVGSISDNAIEVQWWSEEMTSSIDHFNLYQNGEKVDSVDSNAYTYTFESLSPNTEYEFMIEAVNSDNEVLASAITYAVTERAQADMENVTFKVVDSKDGSVPQNLEYSLQGTGENNQDVYLYGYTDGEGFLRSWYTPGKTMSLPAGQYELIVYGNGTYPSTIETIEIEAGQDYVNNPYEIVLTKFEKETQNVVVKVTDQEGNPVESIEYLSLYSYPVMEAFGYQDGQYYLWQEQSNTGEFTIENVVVSDQFKYQLNVQVPGYITYNNAEVTVDSSTEVIEVVVDKGVSLTGTIVDANGNPLSGAYFNVYGNQTYAYGQSNAQGVQLDGLHQENLTVDISMQGYQSQTLDIDAEDFVGGTYDLGEIVLQSEKYVHGKILKENGEPAKNVYVYLYAEGSTWSQNWARTDANGYFKIRNVADGSYVLKTDAYNLPNVEVEVQPQPDEYVITLVQQGEGSFVGEGNGFTASKQTVVPGKSLDYRFNYKNNGTAPAENVEVSLNPSSDVELLEDSILLNGQAVTLDRGKVVIPSVAAGESGTITFKTNVNEAATQTLVSNATISLDENQNTFTATTNVLFVTLNAPEITATSKIKVYGNAKSGAKVEIYDGDVLLAQTTVDSRWWYADVTLPVTTGENSSHQLVAKVTVGERATYSQPVTVSYEPNIPEVTDVKISAGWNQNITINPNTGVVTSAIVEYTPIDVKVQFSGEVDSAKISFLGQDYELTKDGDHYIGGIPSTWSSYGEQMLELIFTIDDQVIKLPLMEVIVLIDPSGYVFEGSMENRLQGATAVVEQSVNGRWQQWNAAFYGQINPQVTDEEGRYGWDVIQGDWRVIFSKEGYDTYTSRTVVVPPAETELNVPLVRTSKPVVDSILPAINAEDVALDSAVEIEFDRLMNVEGIDSKIKVYQGDQLVEGSLDYETLNGYKETPGKPGYFEEDSTKQLTQTIVWKPATILDPNQEYRVVVEQDVKDYAGKTLEASVESTFTTIAVEDGDNDGETPGEDDQDNSGETPGEDDQDNGGETPGEDDQDNGGETPGQGNQDNGGQTPGQGNQDNGGQTPGQGNQDNGGQTPGQGNQDNGGQTPDKGNSDNGTQTPGGNTTNPGNTNNNSSNSNVTVKPVINGNKATVTDEQLEELKNKGTLFVDLQNSNKSDISVEFTADQIELLKDKKAEIQIANGDVTLSIPTSVLTNGNEKTSIHVLKLKDIQNALSPVYDFTITQGGQVISQFSEGVTLTFNVDESRVSNPDNVKVFYWNPNTSKWELIGGSYSNGVVTATTSHFSVYTVFETTSEEVSSPGKSLVPVQQNGQELPNTATNSFNWLLIGLTIILVSCAALFILQRRKMVN